MSEGAPLAQDTITSAEGGRPEEHSYWSKAAVPKEEDDAFKKLISNLDDEVCSNEPLEVKWVNWRWPRYDYNTPSPDVKASIQWVIHNGIVLQQMVLENAGDAPVRFSYTLETDTLIRDLDYLDSSYSFNEDDSENPTYKHMPGPNGYGHVCVHEYESPAPVGKPDDPNPQHSNSMSDPLAQNQPRNPGLDENSNAEKQESDMPQFGMEVKAQSNDASVGDGANRVQNGAPLTRELHSVAAVTTLFCNGEAVKIPDNTDDTDFDMNHTLQGHKIVEFVAAYKIIALPASEVYWENFMVTANEANVNRILHEEMAELWGSTGGIPLCSLGISMMDLNEELGKTTGRAGVDNRETEGLEKVKPMASNDVAVSENKKLETFKLVDAGDDDTRTSVDQEESDYTHDTGAGSPSPREKISSPSGIPTKSSPKSHIEYMVWRHLEHILSVCAVPLSPPSLRTGPGEDKHRRNTDDTVLVALTCGDMSGHRVSTSASFFAFRFLIDVARRLEHSEIKSPYISRLQQRIKVVCRGHIRWLEGLLNVDGWPLKSGCFAANYWVTGKIMPESSYGWQPKASITDTPFQILKVGDYHSVYDNENDKGLVRRFLEKIWVPWLQELNKLDKRASFAWPHAMDGDINTFRLDDHFWLWKALKLLEDMGSWRDQPSLKPVGDGATHPAAVETKQQEEFARIAKRLLPSNVQRGLLKRFTTENDVSRKRMLAVTRSARESRFLLHARDTALFHGYDCGFFLPDSSFQELWENTIEAQIYHDENNETDWGNAIRYALGIVAGTRDRCLNKQSPAGLVQSCIKVLISSGGHHGFFPGQLDEATKKPTLFYAREDRDFYYHANFEINHILLTHAPRIDAVFRETSTSPRKQPRAAKKENLRPSNEDEFLHLLFSELSGMILGLMEQPKRQKVVSDSPAGVRKIDPELKHQKITQRLDSRRSLAMKKVMPFNNLIDASTITVFEEEWLYNYPAFLSTENVDLVWQINSILDTDSYESSSDVIGGIIAHTIQDYRDSDETFPRSSIEDTDTYIADTPKQKHLGKREKGELDKRPLKYLYDPNEELGTARTAEKAKKRFIWMPCALADIALLCWIASTETEKPAMSLFFDRHSRYENHFWDDTTMVLNTWQTELHLSFSVLVDTSVPANRHGGLPPDIRDPIPGNSGKEIWRASIGFRFDGDIFDRYWTCHFIEHIPSVAYDPDDYYRGRPPPVRSTDRHTDKQWRQRKILELHLLDRILLNILRSSQEILKELRVNVTLSSSVLNSDIYLSSKDDSQKFEQLLQTVDDDITSVLHTLQKWGTREKHRGEEKPRWTHNDERKYRGAINKLQGSTERHIRDLEIRRDNVRKLKETLTTRREKARQDLEFHWNENIRYFTYVTVIFLPLGFASSFYSMGGPPEHDLIISLVEFAVAAFAVTVTLLLNAKWILSAFRTLSASRLFSAAKRLPALVLKRATKRSLLVREHQKRNSGDHEPGKEQKSGTRKPGQKTKHQEDLHGAFSSPASFWLSYVFIEIPARRVLRAVFALKRGKLSGTAAANVVLGTLFVPVFGTSWLMRIIGFNILDFLRKLSDWLKSKFMPTNHSLKSSSIRGEDDAVDEIALMRYIHKMTDLPQSLRPFRSRDKVEKEEDHDSSTESLSVRE